MDFNRGQLDLGVFLAGLTIRKLTTRPKCANRIRFLLTTRLEQGRQPATQASHRFHESPLT